MKKKQIIIASCCILLLLGVCFVLSFVFLHPFFFRNSKLLSREENDEIKKIVLSAIKDRYSFLDEPETNFYDQNNLSQIVQFYAPYQDQSLLCILTPNFMNMVEAYDDETFFIKVKMYYPEERYHEMRIKKSQSGYIITYWGIDI